MTRGRRYKLANDIDFNSHAHVERDFSSNAPPITLRNFNSHAHVERDTSEDKFVYLKDNFNSHAHVERDAREMGYGNEIIFISTHTLTWSVTLLKLYLFRRAQFQLTRSRGA